ALPVISLMRRARVLIEIFFPFPVLKTSPTARGSLIKATTTFTTSPTYVKLRDCVPSPHTVMGWFGSACRTKVRTTIPYCPVCRGPTVLKKRTTMTGSLRSFQYASARNSSIILLHAYAHRCFDVGPRTRSASSLNGTVALLPYTSDVDATSTSFFFLLAC